MFMDENTAERTAPAMTGAQSDAEDDIFAGEDTLTPESAPAQTDPAGDDTEPAGGENSGAGAQPGENGSGGTAAPEAEAAPDRLTPAQQTAPDLTGRDFRTEVQELLRVRSTEQIGGTIPQEVIDECIGKGKRLVNAYLDYEDRQRRSELEQLRLENSTLRQNMKAAARAPVTHTAAPETEKGESDPFMKGFEADGW